MAETKKKTEVEFKTGKTTSEYKAMLITSVVGIAMAVIGILVLLKVVPVELSDELRTQVSSLITAVGGLVVGLSTAGYSLSRGMAKKV